MKRVISERRLKFFILGLLDEIPISDVRKLAKDAVAADIEGDELLFDPMGDLVREIASLLEEK